MEILSEGEENAKAFISLLNSQDNKFPHFLLHQPVQVRQLKNIETMAKISSGMVENSSVKFSPFLKQLSRTGTELLRLLSLFHLNGIQLKKDRPSVVELPAQVSPVDLQGSYLLASAAAID